MKNNCRYNKNSKDYVDYQDNQTMPKTQYSSLYFITHIILSFFAVYLSWRCSGGNFNALNFAVALFCPHLYIIWALATNGGCGVFGNIKSTLNLVKT